MMISFSDEVSGLRRAGSAPAAAGAARVRGLMRALAAARILSEIRSIYSRIPLWIEILGLVTKSTAPSSSARKVYFFPRSGKVLVKKLMQTHNDTLARRELDYASRLKVEPVGGDIDLF